MLNPQLQAHILACEENSLPPNDNSPKSKNVQVVHLAQRLYDRLLRNGRLLKSNKVGYLVCFILGSMLGATNKDTWWGYRILVTLAAVTIYFVRDDWNDKIFNDNPSLQSYERQSTTTTRLEPRIDPPDTTCSRNCRIELSKLLGSVGAPLLSSSSLHHNPCFDDHLVEPLLQFCRSHVLLLQTVDCALERLKVSASLQLRSSWQSVERVERATVSRQRRVGEPTHVSLQTLRRLVATALFEQARLLQTCCCADECIHYTEEPEIITLSWIRCSRQELSYLLTQVCEELTTTNVAKQVLEECECSARQITSHLSAALEGLSTTNGCDRGEDARFQMMARLRECVGTAHLALWASCQESSDRDDPTTDASDDWWTRVRELLGNVRSLEVELHEQFFAPHPVEVLPELVEQHSTVSTTTSSDKESLDYEHSVDDPKPRNAQSQQDNHQELVVFTGVGTMPGDPPAKSDSTWKPLPPSERHTEQAMDTLLMDELRNRLEMLHPESVEDEETTRAPTLPKPTKSSFHFLGASGSLLAELKGSIASSTKEVCLESS